MYQNNKMAEQKKMFYTCTFIYGYNNLSVTDILNNIIMSTLPSEMPLIFMKICPFVFNIEIAVQNYVCHTIWHCATVPC